MSDPAASSPKYQEWLDLLPDYARRTPRGTIMCFKINVNRAGNGWLYYMTDSGRVGPNDQPVNNVEEAVQVLRDAWTRAQELANQPQSAKATDND